MSHDATPFADQ